MKIISSAQAEVSTISYRVNHIFDEYLSNIRQIIKTEELVSNAKNEHNYAELQTRIEILSKACNAQILEITTIKFT
ncbi:hypothetical protein FH943_002168 [Enterococcus faecalis]|nr:hypothetical protein [Enterococcus faecalis]